MAGKRLNTFLAIVMTIFMLIIVGSGFIVLVYYILSYSEATYTLVNTTVLPSPKYLQQTDIMNYLLIFAIMMVAASVMFAGIMHYLKYTEKEED
ncbi:MAG: hypothetical protein ACXAC7_07235 [Candidatus Hodarchaeales archaeon]|jgi:hypothetical protein